MGRYLKDKKKMLKMKETHKDLNARDILKEMKKSKRIKHEL